MVQTGESVGIAGGGKSDGPIERESPSLCFSTDGGGSSLSFPLAGSTSVAATADCIAISSLAGPSCACSLVVSCSAASIGTESVCCGSVF